MTFQSATRPSTIARVLDDSAGLMPWIASNTLRIVASHPDLMTRMALIRGDTWKDYQPLFEEAEARGGKREASDGTNIHMVVEALHHRMNISAIPEPARTDGQAVYDAIHRLGYDILESEQFVITRGLPELCAGTLDLMLQKPDGTLIVGDTKSTTKLDDGRYSAIKWAIQTAIYNHGRPYTGPPPQRDRWGRPKVDPEAVGSWPAPVDEDRAVILQVERGTGRVAPFLVDTKQGWIMAAAACELRALRKRQGSMVEAI